MPTNISGVPANMRRTFRGLPLMLVGVITLRTRGVDIGWDKGYSDYQRETAILVNSCELRFLSCNYILTT